MRRRNRLTKSTDFQRVRRLGKSFAHPLMVLIAHPNSLERSRYGIAAGRSVGKAVFRNRAKRRIRSALQPLIETIYPGWDVIILARHPILEANYSHLQVALLNLLKRADIYKND